MEIIVHCKWAWTSRETKRTIWRWKKDRGGERKWDRGREIGKRGREKEKERENEEYQTTEPTRRIDRMHFIGAKSIFIPWFVHSFRCSSSLVGHCFRESVRRQLKITTAVICVWLRQIIIKKKWIPLPDRKRKCSLSPNSEIHFLCCIFCADSFAQKRTTFLLIYSFCRHKPIRMHCFPGLEPLV